jgi:segregation and condensation protein A
MTHEVRLQVFEGPIDLLLHLITRQRVDIYQVSISTITDEYLQAMGPLEDLDLDTSTAFLVVAATLLELKSIRLLPAPSDLDEEDRLALEERDLLLARLVECATFRAAGVWLQAGLERGLDLHPREVSLEPRFRHLEPELVLSITPGEVATVAAVALAPRPVPILDTSAVRPLRASVRGAIRELAERLRSGPEVTFEQLCGRRQRIEVVVRFLGLLELFKAGAIALSQHDRFGDIAARWTGDVELDEVLSGAEEYALEGEGDV